MGNGDSKLDKSLEEDFPSTERYYGLYNVRSNCFHLHFPLSALLLLSSVHLPLETHIMPTLLWKSLCSMEIRATPIAYYRHSFSVNLSAWLS